jgi:hypothetical protein
MLAYRAAALLATKNPGSTIASGAGVRGRCWGCVPDFEGLVFPIDTAIYVTIERS